MKPFIEKARLEEIIKEIPTPFHIYDERGIRENFRKFKQAFSWNKGFKEYFAVKATPNPSIMRILLEEGAGFDCASYTELLMANDVLKSFAFDGSPGEKLSPTVSTKSASGGSPLMFSSNVTPDEDFLLAAQIGAIINLDDFTHIEVLDRLCGIPETISCRYNPGGEFKTDESGNVMDIPKDAKYGFTHEQLIEGYRVLKAKGAKKFGVHSFLASNTLTNDYYPALAKIMFKLAVELKEKTGISLSFINLSGGVGVAYRPEQKPNDIKLIGEGVKAVFEEILVPAGMGDVSIFTELGRFITAPYGALVATALREKHIYKEYIGLDACAANLMRPAIYGAYHHISVMGKENEPHDYKYDITGGLCENNDKFAIDRMLPKIELGDIIYIHDTGAHGFSMGYNYNGKLRSAEVLLCEDGSHKLIRRAETPDDYFATLRY